MPPDLRSTDDDAAMAEVHGAIQAMGWQATDAQVAAWLAHLALIAKWNRTYNLTSVRDLAEMRQQHLVDCLAMVQPLAAHLKACAAQAETASTPRILDVGSGAGLPGVVLAIAFPSASVICVDTVGKKASFVQQVASELRLPNLRAAHARIEAFPPAGAAVVTSRAFASLKDFTALTRSHLADNGVWLAMKGKTPAEEINDLPSDVEVFHVEPLHVPGWAVERCLVWMKPRV